MLGLGLGLGLALLNFGSTTYDYRLPSFYLPNWDGYRVFTFLVGMATCLIGMATEFCQLELVMLLSFHFPNWDGYTIWTLPDWVGYLVYHFTKLI